MSVAIFTLLTASRMLYVWHNQYLAAIQLLTVVASKQLFLLYLPFLTTSRLFLFDINHLFILSAYIMNHNSGS